MMFLFAYLGSLSQPRGWPLHLIYATETGFVAVALACVLLAMILRRAGTQLTRVIVAVVGGISASFGLIMPFELAPFFFNVHGEIMMATIALILVYPVAVVPFFFLFWRISRAAPPPLPR